MLLFSFVSLLSCISSFPEKSIIDNPNDDYDGDGLTEIDGDCDDDDKDIQKIIWYVDGDGDGFGLDSLQTESCTRLRSVCIHALEITCFSVVHWVLVCKMFVQQNMKLGMNVLLKN